MPEQPRTGSVRALPATPATGSDRDEAGERRRPSDAEVAAAHLVDHAGLRRDRVLERRSLLRWGVKPFLLTSDLVAAALGLWAAGLLGTGLGVLLTVLLVVLLQSGRFYRSRLSLSVLDDLPGLTGRLLGATAGTVGVVAVADSGSTRPREVLLAGVVTGLALLTGRTVAYSTVRRCRRRGWVAHPTLVLGAGRVGGMLASLLLEHRSYGLQPVGFLDADPLLAEDERPVPLLGDPQSLAQVVLEFGVRDVVVAFGSLPEQHMVEIIRTCDRLEVEIFLLPRLFELHQTNRDTDQVWGIPLVRLRPAAFRSATWRVKRALDVALSLLAGVVLLPVLLACALAVRLEGGPGVLFRQERVGLDGRRFDVLKFRSMRPASDEESATNWNIAQDDRVGPVGRLLRSTSLDELPQLWNIVRGDMSLVGPRPERPHFVDVFAATMPRYAARHRVPSGLTGWAQVHGLRGDTSIEDRSRFDNHYIENWSLWGDAKIVLRTVSSVLRRAGG